MGKKEAETLLPNWVYQKTLDLGLVHRQHGKARWLQEDCKYIFSIL